MVHADGGSGVFAVVAAALAYEALATVAPRGWPWWRTLLFLSGCGLLTYALTPGSLPWPPGDFRGHMLQHLLIGMLAPLCLVLGAPATLLLRTLPRSAGRAIGRLLRSRLVHAVGNPVVALTLNLGGLAVLYLTPLYAATTTSATAHQLVHAHFLLAGYLFAWAVAGPDPAPGRPSVPARLVVLGVAIAFHATLSQLMYAGVYVQLPVPMSQRQGGATLMYYGGDIAELLLAVGLVATWRPRRPPRSGLTPAGAPRTARRTAGRASSPTYARRTPRDTAHPSRPTGTAQASGAAG
jgi:putative membrane protein